MHPLVLSLSRRAIPHLVDGTPNDGGLKAWLANGSFDVDQSSTAQSLQLTNVPSTEFAPYQASDVLRFTWASYETAAFVRPEQSWPRSIGWPLIKSYYAAFFAGHSLMRMLGWSVINLEASLARQLAKVAKIYGAEASLRPGTYLCRVNQSSPSTLTISLREGGGGSGVHGDFWLHFRDFLSFVENEIATNNDPDGGEAITIISDLKSLLSARGTSAGNWLSQVRNNINYQHQYGVWFPFGATKKDVEFVRTFRWDGEATARLDYDPRTDVIRAFCAGSLSLVALNCAVSDQLARRGRRQGNSFAAKWHRLKADLSGSMSKHLQ